VLGFPAGVAFAELAMRAPAIARIAPLASAGVLLLAGAWQLSAWKARQLACCRETIDCCRPPRATASAAWRHGVDLGVRCLRCCASLTAALFVLGVMDLRAMALVTAAISFERLAAERHAPRGALVARVIGVGLLIGGAAAALRALE